MLYRNREANDRGFSHGGVAVIYKESVMTLKPVKLHNPHKFEVLLTSGRIKGVARPIAVIACYIPPNYAVPRGKDAVSFIAGAVSEAKRRLDDPIVVVAGDYNQWRVEDGLADFPDLVEHDVGPTRGDRRICLLYTSPSPRDS